jgi:hypothetical protein
MDVTTALHPDHKTLDGAADAGEDGRMRSLTWECNHGGA